MDPVTAAMDLIATILKMVNDAKNASSEQKAQIAARFADAEASLKQAQSDAHQALADEVAADTKAIADAKAGEPK